MNKLVWYDTEREYIYIYSNVTDLIVPGIVSTVDSFDLNHAKSWVLLFVYDASSVTLSWTVIAYAA